MVVIGDGNQRTAAMSWCHAEIAASQRWGAPKSNRNAAMTEALEQVDRLERLHAVSRKIGNQVF